VGGGGDAAADGDPRAGGSLRGRGGAGKAGAHVDADTTLLIE
jgi:hypothetical protein